MSAALWTAEARVFPLGGPIWLGAGFAYQTVDARTSVDIAGQSVAIGGTLGVPLFKMGIGFEGRSGLVIGIDVGVNIPLGGRDVTFDVPSTTNALAQAEIDRQEQSVQDSVDSIVGSLPVIPQVSLLDLATSFEGLPHGESACASRRRGSKTTWHGSFHAST